MNRKSWYRVKSYSEVFEEESDIDCFGNPKGNLGEEIFDYEEEDLSVPDEESESNPDEKQDSK